MSWMKGFARILQFRSFIRRNASVRKLIDREYLVLDYGPQVLVAGAVLVQETSLVSQTS